MTHCLNTLANLIQQYIWLAPVLALLGGLVTSFTPCSLSSVPMVIAYIGGSAKNDTKKAFRLSLTMAGGLALTFLIFGSLASVLGHYLHEIGAWWYGILGAIMVLMALQIWGVIRILPNHPHDHGTGEGHGEHGCECHDHHHHHADDVFTSWGTETPKKYEKAELDSILKKLSESEDYGKVLRSKGMLPCTDGTWMYFDLVPEEYEIREGSADFTGRICVIGSELKEDALKELFEV